MKDKREKDIWVEKTMCISDGVEAKKKARELRLNENVTNVVVNKEEHGYIISYSVIKWYLESLNKIGVKL